MKREKGGPFEASTAEAALKLRDQWIDDYLHKKRAKQGESASASTSTSASAGASTSASTSVDADADRTRPPREAAPSSLKEQPLSAAGGKEKRTPGPGRGHVSVESVPEPELLPPASVDATNWLKQIELRERWRTERIAQLERQLATANATNESLLAEVTQLRERVAQLEAAQQTAAEEIMSYVESTPVLKQAAHADALEAHPEWQAILGVGYNDAQRRNLIYQHLGKLLTELRRITGGDATKAKQLSDLLFARTHAGEQRMIDASAKEESRKRAVADAINLQEHKIIGISLCFWHKCFVRTFQI